MKFKPLGMKLEQMQEVTSARGEVSDKNRKIVMEMVNEIPSFGQVSKEQEIKKTNIDTDHVVYWHKERMPAIDGKQRNVMLEVHVDPSDDYSEAFILVEFKDGDKAMADLTIEDLEDYAPGEIDQLEAGIVAATEQADDSLEGKAGADEEALSSSAKVESGCKEPVTSASVLDLGMQDKLSELAQSLVSTGTVDGLGAAINIMIEMLKDIKSNTPTELLN